MRGEHCHPPSRTESLSGVMQLAWVPTEVPRTASQCNLCFAELSQARPRLHRLTGLDPAVVFQAATFSNMETSKSDKGLEPKGIGKHIESFNSETDE